ncbi:glycosyltransferase family 4 protein, partial [Streptomyces sp. SID8455]|nr:glycosyltransferase family 4 protein [Streptomyces sp. SID8455]
RHRMGSAALSASERFDPARIAESHESLFTELVARGARGRGHSPLRTALHRTRGTVLDRAYALRYKAADVLRKGKAA